MTAKLTHTADGYVVTIEVALSAEVIAAGLIYETRGFRSPTNPAAMMALLGDEGLLRELPASLEAQIDFWVENQVEIASPGDYSYAMKVAQRIVEEA